MQTVLYLLWTFLITSGWYFVYCLLMKEKIELSKLPWIFTSMVLITSLIWIIFYTLSQITDTETRPIIYENLRLFFIHTFFILMLPIFLTTSLVYKAYIHIVKEKTTVTFWEAIAQAFAAPIVWLIIWAIISWVIISLWFDENKVYNAIFRGLHLEIYIEYLMSYVWIVNPSIIAINFSALVFQMYLIVVPIAVISFILEKWMHWKGDDRIENNAFSQISQEKQQENANSRLEEESIKQQKNEQELITRRLALVPRNHLDTFLQHAERRFRKKDKYGNSDHTALEKEVLEYLRMIAKTQQRYKDQITAIDALARGKSYPYLNADFKWLYQYLKWKFEEYIENKKNNIGGEIKNIAEMSGIEFEEYLAEIFKSKGYNVQMTPISIDQWADLIVVKNERKIAIQAKRYQWSVWNTAVQEVIAARWYYGCSTAWVITNSFYTSSAQDLAEKNNVRLIDGAELQHLHDFI